MPERAFVVRRAGGAAVAVLLALAACAPTAQVTAVPQVSPVVRAMYGPLDDGAFVVPAIPERYLTPGGFDLPHLKIYDATGKRVLEKSSSVGKLDALIEEVRALVEKR